MFNFSFDLTKKKIGLNFWRNMLNDRGLTEQVINNNNILVILVIYDIPAHFVMVKLLFNIPDVFF